MAPCTSGKRLLRATSVTSVTSVVHCLWKVGRCVEPGPSEMEAHRQAAPPSPSVCLTASTTGCALSGMPP